MTKIKYLTYCFATLALMSPLPTSAFAYSGEKLAAKAKITHRPGPLNCFESSSRHDNRRGVGK